jgi:peptide/nickel transport system substrate-binding protein
MGKAKIGLRVAALVSATAMVLAACGGGSGDDGGDNGQASGKPTKGGTFTLLTLADQFDHVDPQRAYTGEDLAFFGATITRSLVAYKMSTKDEEANSLVPDLATDIGTPSDDAKVWKFTLKDGLTWEDGSPLTCEDIKYGVSRTFATSVITDGPQYQVAYLDIPKNKDGTSVYKGPYETKDNDTAAFDKAVVCNGQEITFNLSQSVPDFNYAATLGFSPVPKAADTGEKYDDKVISNGPYKIQEYSKGNQMVLVRNENWSPESDDYHKAYPDKIVVKFGLDPSVIDQRIIQDSSADQSAASRDDVQPADLAAIFNDPKMADRRVNYLDIYVNYYCINAQKVPNLKQRQAIMVALDRAAVRQVNGGEYAGDLADGVIKPNLPQDYEPTGLWDNLLGKKIPDSGDPEYAKQLIAESGEPMPTIEFQYSNTPVRAQEAAVVVDSLKKAGIKVKPTPIEAGIYYSTIFDPDRAGELMWNGWGTDWPSASTVIPPLFTPAGGWDASQVDDKEYTAAVTEALTTLDRTEQATKWKELNKQAVQNAWVVPTLFNRSQNIAGSKVKSASSPDGKIYQWAPYGSWPYNDIYIEQ